MGSGRAASTADGERRKQGSLSIDPAFFRFVGEELLPTIGLDAASFWCGVESLIDELTPINWELLAKRDVLQQQIDAWHKERKGTVWSHTEYRNFLESIGYLVPAVEPFEIATQGVDTEIAEIAGPQLVVPINNARFAINATNARWGSLYDALYGTDVIDESDGRQRGNSYNPQRGAAVIECACDFLDSAIPLEGASHADVVAYVIEEASPSNLTMRSVDSSGLRLKQADKFVGFSGNGDRRCYLFRNNGLHFEIQTNPAHPIGKDARANVADVVMESAITTIQDCEDSVTAVDAEDKVTVYRNCLGLMRGDLRATLEKNGKTRERRLNADREYTGRDGKPLKLSGRSLMLIRNVGHLMTNDAILDESGSEVFEGILDAIVTTGCALANGRQTNNLPNSRHGSVYIVKPKMHGPDEAAFTDTLFARVEKIYGLPKNTIKVGVMDEERRTTVNLAACISAVKDRLVFINTGFLDRTGDEIHTSMHAGAVLPKETIKAQPWINAYEDWNVDVGIRCGLLGRAQIGKGMWPKPDEMQQMMTTKQAHPEAGASCAWVPSPTAATLHAMHYHAISVQDRQTEIARRELASLDDILTPPLGDASLLDADTIQQELDNNAQGILGYVVRWIDQGIGCSKVPDINDVGLMEDRATLRISSQHIANWLLHGVTSREQVETTFRRMAAVVDRQNAGDAAYRPMSDNFDESIAFQAACDLVFRGCEQPSGYTEPLLHAYRRQLKAAVPT